MDRRPVEPAPRALHLGARRRPRPFVVRRVRPHYPAGSRLRQTEAMAENHNSFGARAQLSSGGADYEIYRLGAIAGAERLPFSLKILLENLLRHEDGRFFDVSVSFSPIHDETGKVERVPFPLRRLGASGDDIAQRRATPALHRATAYAHRTKAALHLCLFDYYGPIEYSRSINELDDAATNKSSSALTNGRSFQVSHGYVDCVSERRRS